MSTLSPELKAKIDTAPETPGCYLFYDRRGAIAYVGKSKCLRNRVRSYFTPSAREDERIAGLLREIADVSFRQTETELDALIEEYLLIKRHKPWFNAQHIRSLRPWFLALRLDTAFPAAKVTQAAEASGHAIGPFQDAFRAEEALGLLNRVWRTPLCGGDEWPAGARPCLYHGMGKCFAPCGKPTGESPHREELAAFLRGKPEAAFSRLEAEMAAASAALRFEEASAAKETLARLTALAHRVQRGVYIAPDAHMVLLLRGFGEGCASAFYVRQGMLHNRIRLPAKMPVPQATAAFAAAVLESASGSFAHPLMERCLAEISAHRRFAALAPDAAKDDAVQAFAGLYGAAE